MTMLYDQKRRHWSVKRIAAKKQCPIMEAVNWNNITPKGNMSSLTAPADLIHRYRVRLALPPDKPKQQQIRYDVGHRIWMKTPNGRDISPFTPECVTGVISLQKILVDGMPCHVRDLRPVIGLNTLECGSDSKLSTQSARKVTIDEAQGDPQEVNNT